MSRARFLAYCLSLVAAIACSVATAAVFTVDSLLDGPNDHDADISDQVCRSNRGNCSLRAAIEQANFLPGSHEIRFAVAGTIALATEGALPTLVRQIEVRGDTAPGYASGATDIGNAAPRIQLDGTAAPAGTIGLRLASAGIGVRALSIVSMPNEGILITSGAPNARIRDCWLGIRSDGTAAGNDTGVTIQASGARVGRYEEGDVVVGLGNVLSANRVGIQTSVSASDAQLHGNRIGVRPNGLSASPNLGRGIEIVGGSGHRIGGLLAGQASGNVIASNGGGGLRIQGGSGHEVKANLFGINRSGAALNSPGLGIQVGGTATDVVVGGSGDGEENQIANHGAGMMIGDGANTALRVMVSNNRIGSFVTLTGVAGEGIRVERCEDCVVLANTILRAGTDGLVLAGDGIRAYLNQIGYIDTIFGIENLGVGRDGIVVLGDGNDLAPPFPSEIGTSYGNKIGFSGRHGVRIDGNDTLLYGATIGVSDEGEPVPNAGDGVNLGPVSDTRIQINAIAHNGGGGIVLETNLPTALGNVFSNNVLAMNAGPQIDIGSDGLDDNDAGDVDEGPNRRLNYPLLLDVQWIMIDARPHARIRLRHDAQAGSADFPLFVGVHLNQAPVREATRYLGSAAIAAPGEEVVVDLRLPPGTRGGYLSAIASTPEAGSSELSPSHAFGNLDGLFIDGFESPP